MSKVAPSRGTGRSSSRSVLRPPEWPGWLRPHIGMWVKQRPVETQRSTSSKVTHLGVVGEPAARGDSG